MGSAFVSPPLCSKAHYTLAMYSSRECRVDMASGPVTCEFDWPIGSLKTLYLPTDPRIGYTSVAELATGDHMPNEEKMTCPIGTASFDSFLLPLPPLL